MDVLRCATMEVSSRRLSNCSVVIVGVAGVVQIAYVAMSLCESIPNDAETTITDASLSSETRGTLCSAFIATVIRYSRMTQLTIEDTRRGYVRYCPTTCGDPFIDSP